MGRKIKTKNISIDDGDEFAGFEPTDAELAAIAAEEPVILEGNIDLDVLRAREHDLMYRARSERDPDKALVLHTEALVLHELRETGMADFDTVAADLAVRGSDNTAAIQAAFKAVRADLAKAQILEADVITDVEEEFEMGENY